MFRHRRPPEAPVAVPEPELVRRELMPSSHAIFWKPLPDSYYLLASMMRGASEQMHLFITQRALMQVERHINSAPELDLGGFLAGSLYECPRSRSRYCIVNTVVPFAEVSPSAIGSRVTRAAYTAVRLRLESHRLSLIGWYRNGAGLGLQLLPDDIETHTEFFTEPWQAVLLIVPDAANPRGAFFTYDRRAGRAYCVPFYELFDQHAAESKRVNTTCISWRTYVPASAVHPLPDDQRELVETIVEPVRIAPDPPAKEPIDEWWEAIKDPWLRLRDVAVAAKDKHAAPSLEKRPPVRTPLPPRTPPPRTMPQIFIPSRPAADVEEVDEPLASPVREPALGAATVSDAPEAPAAQERDVDVPSAPLPAVTASAAASAAAPLVPRATTPNGSPPPRAPVPEASKPNDRPHRPKPVAPPFVRPQATANATRPERTSAPKPPTTPRLIPPKTAEKLAAAASTSPSIALPHDFHEEALRWQRRRRVGFAIAAASFLGVIVLSTIRARTTRAVAAPATAGVATTTDSGVAALSGMRNGVGASGLPVAVDSLSGALAYYRDIENDHREGLVGCRVLDRAYELVGRARTSVDSARSRITGGLHASDSIKVSMLGAELTHVTQTYRRSGCGVTATPASTNGR